ncbi:hypothetical protein EXE46_03825 [Halorubrum sp. GN11_10-6_MGM]|uniref:hypothetical protein n=1 Tax=Halorubrum sp. GN11_10-6_MGM TaxID=2518112 RepID=UPI0010F4BB9C|nr:hypothetical protein [Halorubrum sp. GN11_10-6_MGM]TKX75289.1 hypothetical protein EXE46_03825 [Halorubrum sp. GN11_10-6_MGM]
MRFSRDRRGQSVVVGTVILFGFLIVALASYQALAVPAQNNQAEFDHSQDLQSDMQDLRASLLDIRAASRNPYQRPVRVSLGFRYDSRLFAVNPPSPRGTLATQDRGPIDIQDARVVPSDADRYENTTPLFEQEHDTRLLTYRPGYNEYQNPPRTTFEHSLLYNRFEGANRTVTGQRTVDGDDRQLLLVAYSGDLDRQRFSTTIDPETLDGRTPTIPIEGETSDDFTVTLPTHSPTVWTDLIGETTDEGEADARVVGSTAQSVTIELTGTWDLQMARVGYNVNSVDETPFSNVTHVDTASDVAGNLSRTFDVEWGGSGTALSNDGVSYDASRDRLSVNRSQAGSVIAVNGSVRADDEPVTGSLVDLSTTDPSIAGFSDDSVTSNAGAFDSSLDISSNGTARLFAASGDDVDGVTLDVSGNPNEASTSIDVRIDDLSHVNENNGRFITSFEVVNPGNDFERVEVEYDYLSGGGQDQTDSITAPRGRSEYTAGGTANGEFEITLTAFGVDSSGNEFALASRTITATADATNPVEDDLGTGSSTFDSTTITDRSNPGRGPRYRIEYTVNDAGEYTRTDAYVVSVSPNTGGRDEGQNTAVSGQIDLDPYGNNSEFKVVALVVDDDGVVVDAVVVEDTADGNDPN